MTRGGVLYDPTRPDDVVLMIDGADYLATGWAAELDPTPAPGHKDGCWAARYGFPADICNACQPAL